MKVLWLIAARAGSKSIKNKNISLLAGVPLLCYRIRSALTFAKEEDVWISTDSKYYALLAEGSGATVPFIRPEELASDSAKSEDVVLHAMEWAESLGRKYDAIGLLEPTSPFVKSTQLIEAVNELFLDKEANSIVAVREVQPNTFYIQEEAKYLSMIASNISSRGVLRRQELGKQITPSGGFYISKWDIFKQRKAFYTETTLAFQLPDINGLEIDEPNDLLWANFLIEKNIIKLNELFKVINL